jgi:hypothetical protein
MQQLGQILSVKTDAEYGGRALTSDEAARVTERAKRFLGWASEVVRSL